MIYRWDDFHLAPEGSLLTRNGRQVDVSRRALNCITHLMAQRHRVVDYDELSRAIWGHDDVSHHQLSQVILAARRALGDDGQMQRFIRTLPGIGYRWVGDVTVDDAGLTADVPATTALPSDAPEPLATLAPSGASPTLSLDITAAPAPDAAVLNPTTLNPSETSSPPVAHRTGSRWATRSLSLGVILVIALALYVSTQTNSNDAPPPAPAADATLSTLEQALYAGDFEAVRQGLATLPPRIADSPDARILEIELDFNRGRNAIAMEKIDLQLRQPDAMADPVVRARLLVLKSKVSARSGQPPAEALTLAQSALDLLDAAGPSAAAAVRGSALERRGMSLFELGHLNEALRDLGLAVSLLERSGSPRSAMGARSNMARVWMRMGRLREALATLDTIAEAYRRSSDRIGELQVRNTMTRIQMELLRWDDALASSDRCMQLLREIPDAERRYRSLQLRAQALTGLGRLRLAASQLDEASASAAKREGFIIPAWHHLESGDNVAAMREAVKGLDDAKGGDRNDILLDGQEGALLIWMTAAQRQTGAGRPLPAPTPEAQRLLREPKTALGKIARGRWLWSQGRLRDAEETLRAALAEARAMNHFHRMTLATEPLVSILLQRNNTADAETLVDALHAVDPQRVGRDYRFNALRLQVALAMGDGARIEDARRKTLAVSGERRWPSELLRGAVNRRESVRTPVSADTSSGAD